MTRILGLGALFCGCLLIASCSKTNSAANDQKPSDAAAATARTANTGGTTFESLVAGNVRIMDLTYTLNAKSPYWPGKNYQPFKLTTISTLEKNGVLSKTIFMPEHLGTHIDAPNHFEKDRPAVNQIAVEDLFAPGVVIDTSMKTETNPDYQLQTADIAAWEAENGRIPDGAIVFLMTGWHRFWANFDRYKNQDAAGQMHFPGYSADAARFLVNERRVRGIGIDTLSMDPGNSKDFAVHHVVNGASKYGLENVARLDELPPRGFFVIAAPLKIEEGTGGPTRIFAIVPNGTKK